MPAQPLGSKRRIGHRAGGIAGAPIRDRVGHRPAGGLLERLDHLQHRVALAAAQVEGEQLGLLSQQGVQSGPVALGQIHHMDVVAHAAAIRGRPVAAIHLQPLPAPHRHLAHIGEQVVGDAAGIFPDAAAGMGTNGVEIAQPGDAPARFAGGQIGQQLLHRQLGVAVGIDRSHRCGLRNRHLLGDPVHRGAAAEHKGAAAMGPHRLQQGPAAAHVHVPVGQGIAHGFAHGLEPGEVDHRLDRPLVWGCG